MKLLDLTLATPALNLALDEALLQAAESDRMDEVLRLWESPTPIVVLGRASLGEQEADLRQCEADGIPVLRRCSGGTAVVAGPGCLMYAVTLRYDDRPELRVVEEAHRFVMTHMQAALATLDPGVQWKGSCDLTIGDRKVSGNSLRCKRNAMLYHGTVLYNFDLTQVERWLGTPPREPDYRAGRSHGAFLANLRQPAARIRQAIRAEWNAEAELEPWPEEATAALSERLYTQSSWNLRR